MTTLTTLPQYPVPLREVALKFTTTEVGADYLRVWISDAPIGTPEREKIENGNLGRVQIHEGDSGSQRKFIPQKGGVYRLIVQEYTRLSGSHGGAYERDPNAAARETKVGSEQSVSLTIGQRMTMACGAGQDVATMVLFVFGDTVRATTLADHGEMTPAIIDGATARARVAIATGNVRASLALLNGDTVTDIVGNVSTMISSIVSTFNAHRTQATRHVNNDTDNSIDTGFSSSVTPESMPKAMNAILTKIRQHYQNDNGQGPGTAGIDYSIPNLVPDPYHNSFDYTNMPLFESVSGSESYRAIADVWRSYEAHRVVASPVHSNADNTNTLDAIPSPLLAVHIEFFKQLAALSPTIPETQTSGAVQLVTQVGALET